MLSRSPRLSAPQSRWAENGTAKTGKNTRLEIQDWLKDKKARKEPDPKRTALLRRSQIARTTPDAQHYLRKESTAELALSAFRRFAPVSTCTSLANQSTSGWNNTPSTMPPI